jgi:hypothetical protein
MHESFSEGNPSIRLVRTGMLEGILCEAKKFLQSLLAGNGTGLFSQGTFPQEALWGFFVAVFLKMTNKKERPKRSFLST